jgi:type IX secretion system PorP/SprF family membrane protein
MRFVCALFLTLVFQLVHSQDIHFSLHQMTPLAFNPAHTGAFPGSYRLSVLYRDQYRSVAGKGAYSTPTFSVDAPILKGFKETDWVGVGLFFYTDRSGDAGLTQQSFKVSAAYHLALNKKGSSVLTVAYQTGPVQRFIKNPSDLTFEDGLIIGGTSAEIGNVLDKQSKKGFLDHVGGLRFSSRFNETDEFNISVAAGKFGKPDWSVLTSGGNYRLDPRIHAQIGYSTLMSDKMRFSPNISYQRIMSSPNSTLVAQGHLDYLFNEEKRVVLKGGLGYRSGAGFGDAIQVMFGTDIKEFRVMFAYDVNVSRLSGASGASGGFELSAQYIGIIYKRPNPDPIIFCPRF